MLGYILMAGFDHEPAMFHGFFAAYVGAEVAGKAILETSPLDYFEIIRVEDYGPEGIGQTVVIHR